jgi:hypothetical protein
MVRDITGHNPALYAQAARLPLVEVLTSFEARMRDEAQRAYELECLLFQIAAAASFGKCKAKKPELPAILKEV